MKDLDELLRSSSAPRPRRELPGNFTATVVSTLKAHPQKRQKESRFMKLIHSPVFAVVAAAILLIGGGTAYAATDGFTKPFDLKNIFGYQETIQPDGKKVIAIKTTNCSAADSSVNSADQVMWFRLKDGATINTDEMLRWAQGYCENRTQPNWVKLLDAKGISADNLGGFLSSGTVVLDARDHTLKVQYKDESNQFTYDETTVAEDALIMQNGKTIPLEVIKKGDYVQFQTTTSLQGDVTVKNDNIVYVRRLSAEEQMYNSKYEQFPKQVERVQPCVKDPGSYCTYGFAGETINKDEIAAKKYVKRAYEEYFSALTNPEDIGDSYQTARRMFKDSYTTGKAAEDLERPLNADSIACAQNYVEGTVLSYGSPVQNGNLITVPVIRTYLYQMEDSKNMITEVFADATYDTRVGKISALNCTIEMDF